MTESAGKVGTLLIVLLTSYFYTIRFGSKRKKAKIFFKSVFALGLLLAAFAFFNEHITKKALKLIRPSYTFVVKQSGVNIKTSSLYDLNEQDRKEAFQHIINTHTERFIKIEPKVLNHWIEESGYSFPSGHSFNAFLLAFIMAYSMYHSANRIARYFYMLPFCWATMVGISRVAMGAHTPLDVSFGAAMGLVVAILFLYFDNTKKLVIPSKSNK